MKKFEYKIIQDTNGHIYTIDDLNKAGAEGWEVVWTQVSDNGLEKTLLKRTSEY